MRQSGLETFKTCPYQYKLRYIDNVDTIPSQDPQNALIVGTALHFGCETGDIDLMLTNYFNTFNVKDDIQVNEAIKLEILVPKVLKLLKGLGHVKYEHEVSFNVDGFTGTADLIGHNRDGTVNLYDFKYSNNIDRYMEKAQLHIYKYFLEKFGYVVRRMYFIFIPKTSIRQKKAESIEEFRLRLIQTVSEFEPILKMVQYDPQKVIDSLELTKQIEKTVEFEKTPSRLCDWCEYKTFCESGATYMIIPENKRTEKKVNLTPDIWLFGNSYCGKTTFADQYDNNLMINTDGNVDAITSPVIRIKDEVTLDGRKVIKKLAWENFLDVIAELEKTQTTFENITVDLVEDLYEHCRLYVFEKNKWQHEQDGGYGKGYDLIALEFLSTMKRLKNLGLRLILISKLITQEVTEKTGAKYTVFKPNIKDKFANVIAGIVDMTILIEADGNKREMVLKPSQYVFGGGRTNFLVDRIPLDKEEFKKAIVEAEQGQAGDSERTRRR